MYIFAQLLLLNVHFHTIVVTECTFFAQLLLNVHVAQGAILLPLEPAQQVFWGHEGGISS